MYFASQTIVAARLAALDHYQSASTILLDSTASLVDLYNDAGNQALHLARKPAPWSEALQIKEVVPDFFAGHLRIAGRAHEDWVRLVEAQIHSSSSLVKYIFEKSAHMSPPVVELAMDAAESLVAAGEDAAGELGDASLKAIIDAEKKLGRQARAKRRPRAA